MTINIFSFIVVLGVLVFFHEFGHFIVARLFGVGVEKFSLGFGPRIFGKTVGITDYRISAIPLGGYVKMIGEEPDAEIDPKDIPLSFTHKHVFKKMLIVAAGPFFNILLAVFLFYGLFQVEGMTIPKPIVGTVEPGSPAEKAGLKADDLIVSIDGKPLETWDDMTTIITGSNGKSLSFSIWRNEATQTLTITPETKTYQNIFNEDVQRFIVGITATDKDAFKVYNPFKLMWTSVVQTYELSKLTVIGIVKLAQGKLGKETLGGPIFIAQMAGQVAKAGLAQFLGFIAYLSINLAILNILPIPILDGGHLLFFSIEAILKRPVNNKVREVAQQLGMFVLLVLLIYVFYNDINRVIFGPGT